MPTGFTIARATDTMRYWFTAIALGIARPDSWELALWVTAPGEDETGGTEMAMTGYARQVVTFTAPTSVDPSETSNDALITFGPATAGGPETITHFTCHGTTPSAMLAGGNLDANRTFQNGDKGEFATNAAKFTGD